MSVKPEDIKHDPSPEAADEAVDFGDNIAEPGEEGDEGEDAEASAAAAAEAAKEARRGQRGAKKAAAKAAAAPATKDTEDGAGEGADDGAGGTGDADDADGEDGEEDLRAAGATARRDAEAENRQGWVPPHRLREATQATRQAEARIRELEAQAASLNGGKGAPDPIAAIEARLDPLYEQAEEARAEGRVADAAKLQRQIDKLNREASEISSDRVATSRALETARTAAYDATVEEVELKFPELNPDNEELFDGVLAQEVLDLANGFVASKKMAPKAALLRALTYIFKEEYMETGTAHLYQKRGAAKPADTGKAGKTGADRKAEQVKANLKASAKMPPVLGDAGRAGTGEGKVDLKGMSEKDFDALPESTQARLRGDFIGA